ncbi:hypothetical protein ACCS88_21090 [Rhizobium ruizarguesonis]
MPEIERLLTDGHARHDQKSNGQIAKTPSQPSAYPAEMRPEQFLGLVARRITAGSSWRKCSHIVRPPENFENLPPLLIGKAGLSAGSFEESVNVGQEGSLPRPQVLAMQRCFNVVSEVSSRVQCRCLLLLKAA